MCGWKAEGKRHRRLWAGECSRQTEGGSRIRLDTLNLNIWGWRRAFLSSICPDIQQSFAKTLFGIGAFVDPPCRGHTSAVPRSIPVENLPKKVPPKKVNKEVTIIEWPSCQASNFKRGQTAVFREFHREGLGYWDLGSSLGRSLNLYPPQPLKHKS